jgi:hypothetical protein
VLTKEEIREKIKELKLIETETHKEINILELELRKMKIKEWEKLLLKYGLEDEDIEKEKIIL